MMWRFTLTQRLFIVVCVSFVPTVAILILTLLTLRAEGDRRLESEALNSARLAKLEMRRIVGGVEAVLQSVASSPLLTFKDTDRCNGYLERVVRASPELTGLSIADAEGRVVCQSSRTAGAISVADRDYFRAARHGHGVVVGTLVTGRVSGRHTLPVAIPLGPDSPWPGGVVVSGLDLAWLGMRLRERDFSTQNALTIADRNGTILAHEPSGSSYVGRPVPAEFLALARGDAPATELVFCEDGAWRVFGFLPPSPGEGGIMVAAGVATGAFHAATNRLVLQGAGVAAAGILVAFLLATLTANYFIRAPFQRLIATVEAWQRGETHLRTGLGQELAEFGQAGRALDTFMDQLTAARAARDEAERNRGILARELDHRVKNIIATIQAVARQTFRGKGLDDAVRIFADRLRTMAAAHSLLMLDGWQSAPLDQVIAETTAPFVNPQGSNIEARGPDLQLTSKAAMSLSMALHELCTNAAKYGALSGPTGTVRIEWGLRAVEGRATFHMSWTEAGGPPVAEPTHRGFGSAMIEQVLAQQLNATVSVAFRPAGLVWTMAAPLAGLVETGGGAAAPPAARAARMASV